MRKIIKPLLPVLVATIILGVGAYAYSVFNFEGEVQIDECLSYVGDNTFSVNLYPQGTDTVTLTVANSSPDDIEIDLLSTVTPDPTGINIDIPNKITIPAEGQDDILIDIVASKSATPGTYSILIEVVR